MSVPAGQVSALRVSITRSCDMRCFYCRGPGPAPQPGPAGLRPGEVAALCEVLRDGFGLSRVRLTGGEPLLSPEVLQWVRELSGLGLEVALSTNGQHLGPLAPRLKEAGLGGVNISLDALDGALFRRIGGGELSRTLHGIEAALEAGLAPVKTNTVVLRGWNEGEVLPVARYAFERGAEPRFLELMRIGAARHRHAAWFVGAGRVLKRLAARYELRPLGRQRGRTAMRYEAWEDGRRAGTLGLIAPESAPFCADCGRLRLSAGGELSGCLMLDHGVDLKPCFAGGGRPERGRLEGLIRRALASKPGIHSRRRLSAVVGIGG